ncbi:AAA family ATPase [Azospirillum agricola]|uniref:AAA family ATPase n=1 Tax=Azospirillum agricola TaxID=1720247 RepID=UPI000A0F37DF|nr:P-loop NTPase [Azospirillum agricola]SMH35850.1 AAA domain-containing protein [Azospirillum lipoferum]
MSLLDPILGEPAARSDAASRTPVRRPFASRLLADATDPASPAGDGRTRPGKLIAVVGARGGVGATTVAVHLAAWLSEARGRTALVDLDLQGGTVALALRLKPGPMPREAVEAPDRVDDLFMERATVAAPERLAVLAADEPIKDAVEVGGPAVQALLNRLQLRHDYAVVDVGRPQGRAARAVLEAASLCVLVGDASRPSLRDLVRLRAAAPSKPGARVMTVLNRLGAPGELAMADLVRTLGEPPSHCLPYRPVPLAVAAGIGEPVFRHCRRFREAMAWLGADAAGR